MLNTRIRFTVPSDVYRSYVRRRSDEFQTIKSADENHADAEKNIGLFKYDDDEERFPIVLVMTDAMPTRETLQVHSIRNPSQTRATRTSPPRRRRCVISTDLDY